MRPWIVVLLLAGCISPAPEPADPCAGDAAGLPVRQVAMFELERGAMVHAFAEALGEEVVGEHHVSGWTTWNTTNGTVHEFEGPYGVPRLEYRGPAWREADVASVEAYAEALAARLGAVGPLSVTSRPDAEGGQRFHADVEAQWQGLPVFHGPREGAPRPAVRAGELSILVRGEPAEGLVGHRVSLEPFYDLPPMDLEASWGAVAAAAACVAAAIGAPTLEGEPWRAAVVQDGLFVYGAWMLGECPDAVLVEAAAPADQASAVLAAQRDAC